MKYILTILILTAISCSHRDTELRIDENLPSEYQEAVIEAADQWQEKAGFVIPVKITSSDKANVTWGTCERQTNISCAAKYTEITFQKRNVDINRLNAAALHELGHWLGIKDHLPKGNVMYYKYYEPFPDLTQADINAAWEAQ